MTTEQELIIDLLTKTVKAKPEINKNDYQWLVEELSAAFNLKKEIGHLDIVREINGLAMCLLWGIADSIRNNYTRVLSPFEAKVILHKLVKVFGQQEDFARWCIESWCIAFDKVVDLNSVDSILKVKINEKVANDLPEINLDSLTHSQQTFYRYIYKSILNNQLDDDAYDRLLQKGHKLGFSAETIYRLFELAEMQLASDFKEKDDFSEKYNQDKETIQKGSDNKFKPDYQFSIPVKLEKPNSEIAKKQVFTTSRFVKFLGLIIIVIFALGFFFNLTHYLNPSSNLIASTSNQTENEINPPSVIFEKPTPEIKPKPPVIDKPIENQEKSEIISRPIKRSKSDISRFEHNSKLTNRFPYNGPKEYRVKWKFQTDSRCFYSSPIIDKNGTIYFGLNDGKLYAVSPNGKLKWTYDTGDSGTFKKTSSDSSIFVGYNLGKGIITTPALGFDGSIYIGSQNSGLFAITPQGKLKWSIKNGVQYYSSPTVGANGTIFIYGMMKKAALDVEFLIFAIKPNGVVKWSKKIEHTANTLAIASDGTIYVLMQQLFKLYAFKPDGSIKWILDTGEKVIMSNPAIGSDGTIYVGSDNNNLSAITPKGKIKWTYSTAGDIKTAPAIANDGTIYIRSKDRYLYAITPKGDQKWIYPIHLNQYASPIVDKNGIIYTSGSNGYLEAISPSGKTIWVADTQGVKSTPSISSDGTFYAFFGDECLYAIGPGKEK